MLSAVAVSLCATTGYGEFGNVQLSGVFILAETRKIARTTTIDQSVSPECGSS